MLSCTKMKLDEAQSSILLLADVHDQASKIFSKF